MSDCETTVDDGTTASDLSSHVPGLLKRDLEALLFAAGRPLSVEEMLGALVVAAGKRWAASDAESEPGLQSEREAASDGEEQIAPDTVRGLLVSLAEEYPAGGERGFELVQVAGGWAFRTNTRCREVVSALFELPEDVSRLSGAAMECLAIIAYLQPVSRPQIAEVRGVNSDSPVRTLLERELVTEVGREKGGTGAILYGTTPRFEAMFGLSGLDELPALEGFALTDDQKDDLRRKLGLLTVPE